MYKILPLKDIKLPKFETFFDLENSAVPNNSSSSAPFRSKYGKIELAQFYQRGDKYVQMVRCPDPVLLAKKLTNKKIIGHNIAYDISTIQVNSRMEWIPKDFDCLLIMSLACLYHLDSFSLNNVYAHVLGKEVYRPQEKKEFQKSDWTKELSTSQLEYAAKDVLYLPKVFDYCKTKEPNLVENVYEMGKRIQAVFLKIQRKGIPVLADDMIKHKEFLQTTLNKENTLSYNVRSSEQVKHALGTPDAQERTLVQASLEGNAEAVEVIKIRKKLKALSTIESYLGFDKFLQDTKKIDRLYGFFSPTTKTGRSKSSNHNMQNIPSDFKKFFGYSNKDKRLLARVDFSNLEIRAIATLTNDPVLVKLLKNGIDMHSYMSERIFGKVSENRFKECRFIAKIANFSLLYGAGVNTFAQQLVLKTGKQQNLEFVENVRNKWFDTFKGIRNWHINNGKEFNSGLVYSKSPIGRVMKADRYTEYLNHKGQSLGADVANLAFLLIYDCLEADPQKYRGCSIIGYVHDEFLFDVPDNKKIYKPFCSMVAKQCLNAWQTFSRNSSVFKVRNLPLPVNVCVGKTWEDVKEDKNLIYEEIL